MLIGTLSVLMPLVALIVRRKHIYYTIVPLGVFIIFCLITEATAFTLAQLGFRNFWLAHIYKVVEASLLSAVFYRAIDIKVIKRIILIGTTTFVLLSIATTVFIQPLKDYPTISNAIEGTLIPAWVMLYFYSIYKSSSIIRLEKDPIFWLASGALLYFAGQFLLHSAFNYLLSYDRLTIKILQYIRLMSIVLFYISQTVTICLPKPK